MKISTKLFFWFLIVTFVPVFIVGIIVVIFAQNQFTERIADDLATIADVQEQRLNNVIELYMDTHKIVSADQRLTEYTYLATLEEAEASDVERLKDILLELHRSVGISRAMSIIDGDGTVIASTSPANVGKKRADIESGKGRVQSIASSVQPDRTGSVTVRTIGPIHFNGEFAGVLEIVPIAEPITAIATNFTGLGETGETLLAQRTESGDALFLTPTRFAPSAAMNRTVSRLAFDVPITSALPPPQRVLIAQTLP